MSKADLVLLHGALGAASQFEPWLPLLEPHFQVHVLEFEGHGAQPFADRPFRIAHFAENLRDFLNARGLLAADVFGYSMGGYVALALAAESPDLIGRIFTFASKLAWSPETSAHEVRMLNADKIAEKVPHFAAALEARHHGNDWREHLGRTADLMLDLGAHPVLGPEVYARITQRVRLGIGDRDNMVSLEETIAAYRTLPSSELLVLPATPHPIEKIDPASIVAAIRSFFS